MIRLRKPRRLTDESVAEAQKTLVEARRQEDRAKAKAKELAPVIKKLEDHLAENRFSRLIWESFKGAS